MGARRDIEKRKRAALAAARLAGRIQTGSFKHTLRITVKGDRDYVTNVDTQVEKKIVEYLKKSFPNDNILAEENTYQTLDSPFCWIIDPIDGTHNFMYGIEDFGVSIALAYKNRIVVGVIFMPLRNEMYCATTSRGAFLNNKRIHVAHRKLVRSTMIFDSSIRLAKKTMLQALGTLSDSVFNIRMYGSSIRGLTYLAEGKVDLVVEFDDKIWDCAAGLLLIEEAGGKVTDFSGKKWGLHTRQYVASNGAIHRPVLSVLRKYACKK